MGSSTLTSDRAAEAVVLATFRDRASRLLDIQDFLQTRVKGSRNFFSDARDQEGYRSDTEALQ